MGLKSLKLLQTEDKVTCYIYIKTSSWPNWNMYSKYLKILYFCTEVQWESKNSRRGLSLRYMPSSMCDLKRPKNIYNSLFFCHQLYCFVYFFQLIVAKIQFFKKIALQSLKKVLQTWKFFTCECHYPFNPIKKIFSIHDTSVSARTVSC